MIVGAACDSALEKIWGLLKLLVDDALGEIEHVLRQLDDPGSRRPPSAGSGAAFKNASVGLSNAS